MRILAAEDRPEICNRVKEALDKVCFMITEYRCVPSLHELGNVALDFAPTIILLDLGLDDASPEHTISSIPNLNKLAPVVVITGSAHFYVDCMKRGAYNFLYKPVALSKGMEAHLAKDLKTAVDKWLYDNGRADEISA